MKGQPFSFSAFEFEYSAPCSYSTVGSSRRISKHADISAEQKAGQEIQNILFKRTRPDLVTCAAPITQRCPLGELSEDDFEVDVFSECLEASPTYGESQERWFLNSPTQVRRLNADGSHQSECKYSDANATIASRPHRFNLNSGDIPDIPTTIVGTPPCRAGNPLVNDTRFLHIRTYDPVLQLTTSVLGSELGLFRLSPPAF